MTRAPSGSIIFRWNFLNRAIDRDAVVQSRLLGRSPASSAIGSVSDFVLLRAWSPMTALGEMAAFGRLALAFRNRWPP